VNLQESETGVNNISTKFKSISLVLLWAFTALSAVGAHLALQVPSNYSLDQFLPRKHHLLDWERESKKVFQISEASPHIVLLSLRKGDVGAWYDPHYLSRLQKLSGQLLSLKNVKSVISLGNVKMAYSRKGEIVVDGLLELKRLGLPTASVTKNPLYTPNLISKDGRDSAIFVLPIASLTQDDHRKLIQQIDGHIKKAFPAALARIGGPAAIRTQFVDLLGHEIFVFIILALLGAMVMLKIMFRGYWVLGQVLFVLIVANCLALGSMQLLGLSFTVLSSTLPILVTVSSLGICAHLFVRMAEGAHLANEQRLHFLKDLIMEIWSIILLTGVSTSVGFACLIPSTVPLISNYGLALAVGIAVSSTATLILTPCLFVWLKWPQPRDFLSEPKAFSRFLVQNTKWLVPGIAALTLLLSFAGRELSWTAKLFDDLPDGHIARRTTETIDRKLGGVSNLDITIGHDKMSDPWKQPRNVQKLAQIARLLRNRTEVGSVLTLSDFLTTTGSFRDLPKTRGAIAELQFLYSMSGNSPLRQFLSGNEKWTRIALRLHDLPADKNEALIRDVKALTHKLFPDMQVKVSGLASIVPKVNQDLSKMLMWGFFEALFWIVLVLAFAFRSLRWALVGIVPNLLPPAALLGLLAWFDVPMKPGIAIIFSISLGIAFDNTIYILGRLRQMLKIHPHANILPVYSLMKKETVPCLVSSLSLFGGFAIFLASSFPVNQLFGIFVLISILAGLLGDLVWLPAILRKYPRLLLSSPQRDRMGFLSLGVGARETAMRFSPYLLLLGLGLIAFRGAYANGAQPSRDIKSILKEVERKAAPPYERVDLRMVIQESDGSQKERGLSIIRKNDSGARALIRLTQPADLKGLSLLTVNSDGKEDQWLYLPSDKKSRRILGSNKNGKFLDSDIAYEDLRVSTYKEFNNRILKDDGKILQMESRARPNSDSSYGRIITWISIPDSRIERVEYFDKAGHLLKHASFKNYQKIGSQYWRARQVIVVNVQDKRKTQLIVKRVSVKKITDDEVSLAALEE